MIEQQSQPPRLRRYFFTGILVTAPVTLTLYLTWLIVSWMDALVTPYLPDWINPNKYLPFELPGVGLMMTLVGLTVIGWLMAGFLGRWFTGLIEIVLNRVPIVKTMYTVTKQVLQTALTDKSKVFKEAVLVQFPHADAWVLAFVTSRKRDAVDKALGKNMVSVFVPTTPNLTSGYLIFVEETRVKPVAMPSEEALKLIISGGLIS